MLFAKHLQQVIKLQDTLQHLESQYINTYEKNNASQNDPYVRDKY